MHIGFIGLGNMGGPMAARLRAAGHALTVFDIDAARMAPLAAAGAATAASARSVGDAAETVIVSLPSVDASRAVAAQVLQRTRVRCYVETSTIGRATIEAIVGLAPPHVHVIDAPISGGAAGARAGTLAITLAGATAAVREFEPILAAVAAKTFHVGETPGLAQVCKLANNAITFAAMVATCEAVVLAVKAGADPAVLIESINAGTGRNAATVERFPKSILPRTFDGGAPLGGAAKDLALYLEEAGDLGVRTELVQRAYDSWEDCMRVVDPASDYTTIIRYFEARAGVEVKGARAPDATGAAAD
jgi:3-hydroxyisobutyrate dehydrogenase-like beta-hydroxyacid dehydrogenase